jgi:kinesin family protein 11
MTEEQEERRTQLEDALQRASAIENKHATLSAEFETNMAMLVVRDEELKVARKEAVDLGVALEQVRQDLQLVQTQLDEEKVVSEAYRRGEAKLDRVAKGLKGTVEETVKDVGGLFAKIGELCCSP